MVLWVTDFTLIARFICFMHIVYNSVVVVVVLRIGCYNDYFPQVKLCWFFWNTNHEKKNGRKCWMCTKSKPFSVGKLVHNRYVSWECQECMHVNSSLMIWACNVGDCGGVWVFFY